MITGIVVLAVVLLIGAFVGGAWCCFWLFENEIKAGTATTRSQNLQAQVDAIKTVHQIDETAWQAERAMLRYALGLDESGGRP